MRIVLFACSMLLVGSYLVSTPLFAKPERLKVQSDEVKAGKSKAKALAKTVDLTAVDDPDARVALQAIFNALNLKAKK